MYRTTMTISRKAILEHAASEDRWAQKWCCDCWIRSNFITLTSLVVLVLLLLVYCWWVLITVATCWHRFREAIPYATNSALSTVVSTPTQSMKLS